MQPNTTASSKTQIRAIESNDTLFLSCSDFAKALEVNPRKLRTGMSKRGFETFKRSSTGFYKIEDFKTFLSENVKLHTKNVIPFIENVMTIFDGHDVTDMTTKDVMTKKEYNDMTTKTVMTTKSTVMTKNNNGHDQNETVMTSNNDDMAKKETSRPTTKTVMTYKNGHDKTSDLTQSKTRQGEALRIDLQSVKSSHKAELTARDEEIQKLKEQLKNGHDQFKEVMTKYEESQNGHDQIQKRHDALLSDKETVMTDKKEVMTKYDDTKKELETVMTERDEAEKRHDQIKLERDTILKQRDQLVKIRTDNKAEVNIKWLFTHAYLKGLALMLGMLATGYMAFIELSLLHPDKPFFLIGMLAVLLALMMSLLSFNATTRTFKIAVWFFMGIEFFSSASFWGLWETFSIITLAFSLFLPAVTWTLSKLLTNSNVQEQIDNVLNNTLKTEFNN